MTTATSLQDLGREINEINRANGWAVCTPEDWDDTYKVPAMIALIHSEASEALEGFRENDKANFEEELADVIIRTLDCASGLGLNLDQAVATKLDKNRSRPHRHGGKRV
ncbi:MAG: MazG nucleotide pyrophosphohydrolase domain-containing protein [Verrucomicrobiota bacterium]